PHVLGVEAYPLGLAQQLAAAYLPEPGQAGAHGEEQPAGRAPIGEFGGGDHARPDEAHLAADDVHQLRQLVEAELSKPASDPSDPGVPDDLVRLPELALQGLVLAQDAVGIRHHGADLEGVEGGPAAADHPA